MAHWLARALKHLPWFAALEARASDADVWRFQARALQADVFQLRRYIDNEMKKHFEVYNGGLMRQMRQMSELRLPTPWVPEALRDVSAIPDMMPLHSVTYVRESRMVPISEAGRI